MQPKQALLSGAAAVVLIAAGYAGGADAKTVKHHHKPAAAPVKSDLEAKVETLTAAVSALEGRLNEETQARQATQAQAQAAQADAAAARAEAQAAHAQLAEQIQTIPGVVSSAVTAATPKPKPSWADNTHVSSTVFADLSNIHQTPGAQAKNGTGFDIKRAYLGVDHSFNDIYSANLTIDFAPGASSLTGGGSLVGAETIKYAYVQAKYADALVIQAGAEKNPWIPFVEDLYGYRYVDKVFVDYNKFGNSSDWGVNAHGSFAHDLVEYSVSVIDGGGYKTPDRSQEMDVEGRVNVNYHGFVAAIGGYDGKLSKDYVGGPATPQTAARFDALVAYTNSKLRLGVEYLDATNWNVVTGVHKDQSEGVSAFGSYIFVPQWSVFGRYDALSPSQKLASAERFNYYNLGIAYEPVKTFDIGLVFKHEGLTHAAAGGWTDGTTALIPGAGKSANYNEAGLFTQFKF